MSWFKRFNIIFIVLFVFLCNSSSEKKTIVSEPIVCYVSLYESLNLEKKQIAKTFMDFIVKVCEEEEISPYYVFFIIEKESEWNPFTKSKNKNGTIDYGLMQLNSKYLKEYITKYGKYKSKKEYEPINNPRDNVELGIRYFALLYRKTGNYYDALLSYNCGLTALRENKVPLSTYQYAQSIIRLFVKHGISIAFP